MRKIEGTEVALPSDEDRTYTHINWDELAAEPGVVFELSRDEGDFTAKSPLSVRNSARNWLKKNERADLELRYKTVSRDVVRIQFVKVESSAVA